MVKIAVVGAGYWGKNLLRVFNELGALYAICESNPDNPKFFTAHVTDKYFYVLNCVMNVLDEKAPADLEMLTLSAKTFLFPQIFCYYSIIKTRR